MDGRCEKFSPHRSHRVQLMMHSNGNCDFALVPMTAEYILYLLGYMEEVRRMHQADDAVYSLECARCEGH